MGPIMGCPRQPTYKNEFQVGQRASRRTSKWKKINGPFLRYPQLNIEMDSYAKRGVQLNEEGIKIRPIYSHTVMGIYNEENHLMTNITEHIYEHVNGKQIKKFTKAKYHWDDEAYVSIHWHGLNQAITTYTQFKRTKICQLMFNWQNTGFQKIQIEGTDGKCPTQCGEIEGYNHYLACRDERMKKVRYKELQKVKKGLEKSNTYPGIITAVLGILSNGIVNTVEKFTCQTTPLDKEIQQALDDQFRLDQNAFEKGFLSNKWQNAHNVWKETQISSKGDSLWIRNLILLVHEYTYTIWKFRNEIIHGQTKSESIQAKKAMLQTKNQGTVRNAEIQT